MAQKDLVEKVLADYNDVFADIINVLIFNGEERVKLDELENTAVHSQYKAEDGQLHEEERDVSKYWKKKEMRFTLFGLENQTNIDKNMPIRIIGYDGASYRSQLAQKMKKVVPVVTLVLYFGTRERWNKNCSLKEVLDVPRDIDNYVNEYKINVFEIAWLTDEQLKMFKSDFGIVANFFVQKRKNKDYVPDDKRIIKHVDEVLKLLSVLTGDSKYERVLYNEKDGVNTMCEVAERLVDKGENMMATLIKKLSAEGRTEDIVLAAEDEEVRKRFYKEFGIID